MARPTPDSSSLVNGQEGWDAVLRDLIDAMLKRPFPVAEYADFASLPAAASYDRCLACTSDTDTLYWSTGGAWVAVYP
jgi:hypothetical protein